MTITFTPAPTVDAGVDGTVCENNPSITLNGSVIGATGGIWSGGSGSYSPNNTTMNAVYTPSAAELSAGTLTLTLTSVGNGNCIAVTDQVTYTVTPSPVANAGTNQTLCSNAPVATLNGSVSIASGGVWSGGLGSFNPSNTNLSATYTPTAAEIASGTLTLTLTTTGNGNCLAASDQIQLDFTPSPTADAGADVSICENNSDIIEWIGNRCRRRYLERRSWILHAEQHDAECDLYADTIGDHQRYTNAHINNHRQRQLCICFGRHGRELHPCSDRKRGNGW